MFPLLTFPISPPHVIETEEGIYFFDILRKKQVVATPEEWVRQHVVRFLIEKMEYPQGRISIESTHKRLGMNRRSDLLIYSETGNPVMLVECKAPEVKIDMSVLNQAIEYDKVLKTKCIMLTNGMMHFIFIKNGNEWIQLREIPTYSTILQIS